MMQPVYIRVDGGRDIGMGHVIRCIAFAERFAKNHPITFFCRNSEDFIQQSIHKAGFEACLVSEYDNRIEETEIWLNTLTAPGFVVIDGYEFRTEIQKMIKQAGHRLLAIDDLHAWPQIADAVLNHSGNVLPTAYECAPYTNLLLGLSYRLLRQEFFKYQSVARKINTISSVIISMGASDVHNNTLKFGLACQRIPNFQKIKLLTSKLNPHYEELVELASSYAERIELYTQISASELIDHIASTDLMICPASSIALESCSIGIPLLTGFTANNQKGILGGLVSAELIAGALNFNELTIESAQIEIRNILDHQGVIQEQLIRQYEIFNMHTDYTIEQLFDAKAVVTTMRKLQWHDEHLLLMWTNDPVVRQHSFNSAPVLLKNHQHWFKSKMTSETSCTYLLEYNQSPAGVIRFEVDQNKATLNYSVSSLFRSKGLSKILVYKGLVQLAQEHPEIQIVYAHVKADNQASLNVLKQFESTQENENSVVFQIDLTQYRNCQS